MPEWPRPASVEAAARPTRAQRLARYFGLDIPWGQRQPQLLRFIVAAAFSVIGSLAACAVVVILGTGLFPATAGYAHFRFPDYAKLTVIGVVVACLAWPLVTLLSSRARRLFGWLTVAVTLGGLAPDAWILYRGAPPEAVVVLVAMHLALAAVTYPALMHIAPQRRGPTTNQL